MRLAGVGGAQRDASACVQLSGAMLHAAATVRDAWPQSTACVNGRAEDFSEAHHDLRNAVLWDCAILRQSVNRLR